MTMSDLDGADPRDSLLHDILTTRDALATESFEARVATLVVQRLRPTYALTQLKENSPNKRLSLASLDIAVPDLPLSLIAHAALYVHQITAAELLSGQLLKTPLFRDFSNQAARRGLDPYSERLGLVTPWHSAPMMILHNVPHQSETIQRQRASGRFVFVSSKRQKPVMFVLEPFDSFLAVLVEMGYGERTDAL